MTASFSRHAASKAAVVSASVLILAANYASDWFRGVLAIKSAKDGALPDGPRANQWHLVRSRQESQLSEQVRARRDELEEKLASLRRRKTQSSEEEYLDLLEPILVELAGLYEGAAASQEDQR